MVRDPETCNGGNLSPCSGLTGQGEDMEPRQTWNRGGKDRWKDRPAAKHKALKSRGTSGKSTCTPPSSPPVSCQGLHRPNPMGRQWTVQSPGNSIPGWSSPPRMENGAEQTNGEQPANPVTPLFDTSLRNSCIFGMRRAQDLCQDVPFSIACISEMFSSLGRGPHSR